MSRTERRNYRDQWGRESRHWWGKRGYTPPSLAPARSVIAALGLTEEKREKAVCRGCYLDRYEQTRWVTPWQEEK